MDIDRIIAGFERRSPASRARIGETVRLWIEGAEGRRGDVAGMEPTAAAPAYPAFARRPLRAR